MKAKQEQTDQEVPVHEHDNNLLPESVKDAASAPPEGVPAKGFADFGLGADLLLGIAEAGFIEPT